MFVGTVSIQEKDNELSIPGTLVLGYFSVQSETRPECVERPSLEKLTREHQAKSLFCAHPFLVGTEADGCWQAVCLSCS